MSAINYNTDFESFKWEDASELQPKRDNPKEQEFFGRMLASVLSDIGE